MLVLNPVSDLVKLLVSKKSTRVPIDLAGWPVVCFPWRKHTWQQCLLLRACQWDSPFSVIGTPLSLRFVYRTAVHCGQCRNLDKCIVRIVLAWWYFFSALFLSPNSCQSRETQKVQWGRNFLDNGVFVNRAQVCHPGTFSFEHQQLPVCRHSKPTCTAVDSPWHYHREESYQPNYSQLLANCLSSCSTTLVSDCNFPSAHNRLASASSQTLPLIISSSICISNSCRSSIKTLFTYQQCLPS